MMIAKRILRLKRDHDVFDIAIRIYAPAGEGRNWSCRYEIDWPEGLQVMNVSGADSVQALVLALQMIGADLYSSSYHKSGRLMFGEPGRGYGFPVAPSLRDLLIGDDRKYGA
jgi:hypothetical protein